MYQIDNISKENLRIHFILKILNIVVYILIIPLILVNLTLLVKSILNPNETPDFLGIKTFVIVSRSMEPQILKGDAIFVEKITEDELKVDDIISFRDEETIVTHRIIDEKQIGNDIYYTTKGDNNRNSDKQTITFDAIEGRYLFKLNGFGTFMEIITNRVILVILFMLLLLNFLYMGRLQKRKKLRKLKRDEYKEKKIEEM